MTPQRFKAQVLAEAEATLRKAVGYVDKRPCCLACDRRMIRGMMHWLCPHCAKLEPFTKENS
jgi:hypothetical protein